VLNQEFDKDQFEVIVVNDSGRPLKSADWQYSDRVQIINTNRRERSFARNAGAAIARGHYLHFLDDDDWMTPFAFKYLSELSHSARAKWLYGASVIVGQESKPLVQLHHGLRGNCFVQVMAGEWIPLQASLIEAERFFSVGGFNQRIVGPEDIDLLRRIALYEDLAETEAVVAYIFQSIDHSTTDFQRHPEISRWAREPIIGDQRGFRRLLESANSPYWRGRIVRLYFTSLLWNLWHGKPFVAFERGIRCANALICAVSAMFFPDFWRAFVRPYDSFTFQQGLSRTKSANGSME
jgi:glycosyltransferase involved in cell wall biosynthesis